VRALQPRQGRERKLVIMGLDNEAPYSFTAKTPAGNLFTVRGRTFEEFKANMITARNGNAPAPP
jgi:hypothetical protein